MKIILAESGVLGRSLGGNPHFFSECTLSATFFEAEQSSFAFISFDFGLFPSFPFILAFWAFISFHFGLLGLHFKVAGACRELQGLMLQSSILGMCFKYRSSNARCVWINTLLQHKAVATHR